MGYQESYVRTKKLADFNNLVEIIRAVGKEYYEVNDACPVEIITLKKSINGNLEAMCRPNEKYEFNEGEKFIYFVGERYIQRNSLTLLNNSKVNGIEIYFAECFPSDEIFNAKENDYAVHEDFIWENT